MRWIIALVVVFSFQINILGLTGSFFMLQVYDRVIPSGSIPTLVSLAIIAVLLYAFYGLLIIIRSRVLVRLGQSFDNRFSRRIFTILSGSPLRQISADSMRPAREFDQVRSFVSGAGLAMLFDLPWLPIYLALCFFLHPLIGLLAVGAIVTLVTFNVVAGYRSKELTNDHAEAVGRRNKFGEAVSRNAESLAAMGMMDQAYLVWETSSAELSEISRRLSDTSGFFSGLSRTVRNTVQSAALGIGAYLVIQGNLSGGAIIAGSIIVSRTLAPVEQMIAYWRNLLQAYQAWSRLKLMMKDFPEPAARTSLPIPKKSLTVQGLDVAIPGQKAPTVSNIGFDATAGTIIGVVGPSGSGKSTFVRGLTGIWAALRGRVALDGASIDQWSQSELGKHIGYMPQVSEFFPGTIASNIARLNSYADHETIVRAAKAAGAHEMIVGLAEGYDTVITGTGGGLSAGQCQRIALARALFEEPFLVVLDEPNSSLDASGDQALVQAIKGIRERGGIAVVIAHRNSILSEIDFLLVIEDGTAKAFGPRDAVLKAMQQQKRRPSTPGLGGPALAVIGSRGRRDVY